MKAFCFRRLARILARLLAAAFFLLPLVWVFAAALHPPGVPLPTTFGALPAAPTLANFARLPAYFPLGRMAFNSVWISLSAVAITLFTASLFAFGMALLPQKSQRKWLILLLALMMLPEMALWVPRFLFYKALGWVGTPLALIAPAWVGTSPFFMLMYYRAFRRVPAQTYEAARMDGAGILQTWWGVALPIVQPTTLAVGLLSFILYWGDFSGPLLYLSGSRYATLPLALQTLQQLARADWSLLMAGVVAVVSLPVGLFLLLLPYFNRKGLS